MLKSLVRKNRSYRRFDGSVRISKVQLHQLVGLVRLCPSAGNRQILRFYCSSEPKTNKLIFPHLHWAAYLRDWKGPAAGEHPTAYILIMGPRDITQHHLIDAGIASQTMLLGATEIGFGGCQLASFDKQPLHDELKLPPELTIILVIALGKPVEQVVLEKVIDPDDIEYYNDEFYIHHVPKRALKDLLIK